MTDFGGSYPPGITSNDIDENFGAKEMTVESLGHRLNVINNLIILYRIQKKDTFLKQEAADKAEKLNAELDEEGSTLQVYYDIDDDRYILY